MNAIVLEVILKIFNHSYGMGTDQSSQNAMLVCTRQILAL